MAQVSRDLGIRTQGQAGRHTRIALSPGVPLTTDGVRYMVLRTETYVILQVFRYINVAISVTKRLNELYNKAETWSAEPKSRMNP